MVKPFFVYEFTLNSLEIQRKIMSWYQYTCTKYILDIKIIEFFFSCIFSDSGAVSAKKTKTDDSKDEKVKESNDKKSNTSSEVTKKYISSNGFHSFMLI